MDSSAGVGSGPTGGSISSFIPGSGSSFDICGAHAFAAQTWVTPIIAPAISGKLMSRPMARPDGEHGVHNGMVSLM